jgi:WYL domain
MGRRGQSITLSISDRDKALLEALALEYAMTWGDRPNISKLVEAIARRELRIAPNHDWPLERITALNNARAALIDAGQIETAIAIAHILLERGELTIPLRNELERFVENPVATWRINLERNIRCLKPFQLSYQDAAERIWQFTVRHAAIVTHEERQYLDCWCEETEGNQDLPELAHNWSLRLDRITDAAIAPVKGSWRPGLAMVPVEMYLFNSLAFAYRSKTNQDLENEWLPERSQVRRVVRRVTSTFWFTREVLRYGQDCEVISPDTLRDRIRHNLTTALQRYSLTP